MTLAILVLIAFVDPKLASEAEAARQKDDPAAPALYAKALKADPAWKEGWWGLGTLQYGKDRFPQCRDAFQKLTALDASNGAAWAMLGLCEFGTKQYDASLEHLEKSQQVGVGIEGIATVARFHLAQLLTKSGQFENALTLLAGFAAAGKDNQAYIFLGGLASLWKPLFADEVIADERELIFLAGRAFFDASARRASAAKESFETLVRKYPSSPGVHYLYGAYELGERPDRALEEFAKELTVSPNHPGALTATAAEYLRRGEPDRALPFARKAVESIPDSFVSHTLLGRALTDTGDLQGALKELETAKKLAPTEPQPRIVLASVYAKLGRPQDAARERQEFLRLNTKKPGEQ